jgi:hypothetical protein
MDKHYGWIPSIGRLCLMFASVTTSQEKWPLVLNIKIIFPELMLLFTWIRYWDLGSLGGMNKVHGNVGGD